MPMRWAAKQRDDDDAEGAPRCACCDRPIRGRHKMVDVIRGGSTIVAPGTRVDTSDPGYMGCYPVGNVCARKHFKGFAYDADAPAR